MEYIKSFKDVALNCCDHCEEKTLVEMRMGNMIMEYRAVLENLESRNSHSYCKRLGKLPNQ